MSSLQDDSIDIKFLIVVYKFSHAMSEEINLMKNAIEKVEELFSYINTLPDVVQTKILIQIKQKLIDNKIKFQNVSDILQGKNNLLNHETNKSLSTNVIQGINNASLTKIISVCPSKTLESDYLNYTSTNETSSSSVNPKIQQKILNTTEKKNKQENLKLHM